MANDNTEYRPNVELDESGIALPLSLASGIYNVLDRRKGKKLWVHSVSEKINYTDYIVLCTASSSTHVRSLADEVEYRLGLCGIKPDNREGKGDGNSWMVVDYGNVMVHIFTGEAREFYNLDRLFEDAEKVEVVSDIAEDDEAK